MDTIGFELPYVDQLLDLSDGRSAGHGAERVEIASRGVESQVPQRISYLRPDQRKIGDYGLLQQISTTPELTGFFRGRTPATLPSELYLETRPPSETRVPTPAGV